MIEEFNTVSGVVTAASALFAVGTWSLMSGTYATFLASGGAVIAVVAVISAGYRSFPAPLRQIEDIVGKMVDLRDLSNIHPTPSILAIVGVSMSGKTTLRNCLAHVISDQARTQTVTAQILALQTAPPTFIALLDGGGERYAQQFDLVAKCDHLCIVIDHNTSSDEAGVLQERLDQHAEFLKQVRHFFDQKELPSKKSIQLLVNKKDLWKLAEKSDIKILDQFCERELGYWKQGLKSNNITMQHHSNEEPADIARFTKYLKECVISGGIPHE
ncbi:50S ribosome-binding GTPase [Undibacterium sp. NL8W]|uniref:50S ribosome-binding GTPase n=2 Tax=Undibacterium umbellatum TaxID=2762300 RepID=A0ABR6ZI80_9BURK|nr:50S ribosome-binding GTPase [Undibacterium umbellatum]